MASAVDPSAADLSQPFGSYPAILARWASARPNRIALRDDTGAITWAQLHERVERIAARLLHDGLARGQAVAILGSSSVAYALVFLAAVRAGGVAAPLTTSASAAQLAAMTADSGADTIFLDRAKLDELGQDCFAGMTRIVLDEELDGWMATPGTRCPDFVPEPGDPFNIIYSSGTTGVPKGIVHSHAMRWRQFAFTAAAWLESGAAAAAADGSDGDGPIRSLASTPLYSNTTMIAFLAPLLAGGSVRIMGRFRADDWLSHAERDGTTVTMLVPIQYQRLVDAPRLAHTDLSALRLKYCTSAPFSAALKRAVLARMPGALVEIYSMTEGGVVCLLSCHDFPDKLHTVGRPAPGSELKVLDDADRPVPPGTAGHLVGRGPAMMAGYHNQPGKTAQGYWHDPAPPPGDAGVWQRMGDIGRIDADGFVELVGRANDTIISGGFNIYPIDLEAELLAESDVVEAAVIGIPSPQWGETPVAFVVLTPGARSAETIRAAVNARLGKTQRLSALYTIDRLPRSHIGKLLKTALREEMLRRADT